MCKRSETSWADLIDWRVRQGSNSFPRSTPSPAVPGETAPVRSTRGSPAVTDSRPHPARPGAMRAVVRQTRVPGENRNGAASGGRGSGPALPCPPAAAGAEGAPPALPRGSAYLRSCPLPCPGPPPLAQRSGSSPPPRGGGCAARAELRRRGQHPPHPRCCRAAPAGSSPAASGGPAAEPGASAAPRAPGRPPRPAGGPWRLRLAAPHGTARRGLTGRRRGPAAGEGLAAGRASRTDGASLLQAPRVRLAAVAAGGISNSCRVLWSLQSKVHHPNSTMSI